MTGPSMSAPKHGPPLPGHPALHVLLMTLIAACPSTPSPYAPWVWGSVVLVVVLIRPAVFIPRRT